MKSFVSNAVRAFAFCVMTVTTITSYCHLYLKTSGSLANPVRIVQTLRISSDAHKERNISFWTKRGTCNENILLYNRYPKSGSTTFSSLLSVVAKKKGYFASGLGNQPRHMNSKKIRVSQYPEKVVATRASKVTDATIDFLIGFLLFQAKFVRQIQSHSNGSRPSILWSHFHFVDLENHKEKNPVYFNVIRDPVTRFISYFFYTRKKGIETAAKMYASKKRNEPDIYAGITNLTDWFLIDINDCVHKEIYECNFESGKRRDLSVVSYNQCNLWLCAA